MVINAIAERIADKLRYAECRADQIDAITEELAPLLAAYERVVQTARLVAEVNIGHSGFQRLRDDLKDALAALAALAPQGNQPEKAAATSGVKQTGAELFCKIDWETECAAREDRTHCTCWYDGSACCSCGDPAVEDMAGEPPAAVLSESVKTATGSEEHPSAQDTTSRASETPATKFTRNKIQSETENN